MMASEPDPRPARTTIDPVGLLRQARTSGRLPHGLLFSGPEGTDKLATALWLAQLLLCEARAEKACGACGACGRVERQTHPDLHRVAPDGTFIKIAQIRSLIRTTSLKPFEGVAHVVVIEEAHQLVEAAANALLKTLEEPPPDAYLLLLTSKADALLDTIRSRTQRLLFRPQPREALTQTLIRDDGLDAQEARLRALYADGSLTLARSLDLEARQQAVESAVSLVSRAVAPQTRANDVAKLLGAAQEITKGAPETELFLHALKGLLRDAAVTVLTGRPDLALDEHHAAEASSLGRRLGVRRALTVLADIEQIEDDFQHNASRRLALESIFLSLWRNGRSL